MTNENAFLHQLKRSYLWSGVLFARRSAKLEFAEELSSAVDYDWYFKHYFKGSIIHFIDSPLARYRLHEKNTSKKLSKSTENVMEILNKYDFGQIFDKFLEQSNSDELYISFAWYYFTTGKYESALEKLTHVASVNFDKRFMEAVILALRQKDLEAVDSFQSICKEFPQNSESINNLAVCMLRTNNNTDVPCKLLRKSLELNPNYLDARHNLSIIDKDKTNSVSLKITLKPLRSELTHIDNY
jgi:tetratricopeptide (TPR) repeat protein